MATPTPLDMLDGGAPSPSASSIHPLDQLEQMPEHGTPANPSGELPLSGYGNATLQGLSNIGEGVIQAGQGLYNTFRHPIETAKGIAQLPAQAAQVPGAIRDINASADPLGTYANVAGKTAGNAAGQAVVAAATPDVPGAVKTTAKVSGKALSAAATPENIGTAIGAYVGHHVGESLGIALVGRVIGKAVGKAIAEHLSEGGELPTPEAPSPKNVSPESPQQPLTPKPQSTEASAAPPEPQSTSQSPPKASPQPSRADTNVPETAPRGNGPKGPSPTNQDWRRALKQNAPQTPQEAAEGFQSALDRDRTIDAPKSLSGKPQTSALQGGHAGNTVASAEEVNRPGVNVVFDRTGQATYHGKAFAPESAGPRDIHATMFADGTYRINNPEVTPNPSQTLGIKKFMKEYRKFSPL